MNIPLLIVILYVLLLFCISIYVSYGQKKDSENFLLYKGKNNAFVVAASIAGLAIGGASTIGIAENAFTVGLSAGWYDTAWAIGAVVSSMLAVRYLRRSQYTTISGLVRDLYGTKTSLIMVIAMCIIQSGIIALQYKAGGSILASLLPDAEASVALPMILMSIPPVLGGITLSGLWAADMGTGCSMIIGLATTVSTDIIGKIPGVSLNDRQKHILNKVIVVLSSLVTYLIATQMGAILSAMQKALSLRSVLRLSSSAVCCARNSPAARQVSGPSWLRLCRSWHGIWFRRWFRYLRMLDSLCWQSAGLCLF